MFSPLPSPETTNTAPLPVGVQKYMFFTNSTASLHPGFSSIFLVKRSADVTMWFFMSNPGSGPGLEPLKGSTDGLERLLHGHAGDSEGSQPCTAQHSSVGSPSTAQFSPADCPSSVRQAVPAQPSPGPQAVPAQPSSAPQALSAQPSLVPGPLPAQPSSAVSPSPVQPSTGAIPARPCPGSTVRVSG